MSKFIDEVDIEVISGDGGDGIVAWRREKYEPLGGPAGGNGGKGGSIILEATNDMNTLLNFRYKRKFKADNGTRGGSKKKNGKRGTDLVISVPAGTAVLDTETGVEICDLKIPGSKVMVAEGGAGGRGNALLASPTRRSPHHCEPGQKGVTRKLSLVLKVLADVGLVGLPNAGKSTFLSVVTRAKPKIADYPFTTLDPNLGVFESDYGDGFVIADIPGLIEGASQGVGLGDKFLKHLTRCRLLLHLVDISSEDPIKDMKTINSELENFGGALAQLPQITVLNKADLLDSDESVESVRKLVESNFEGQQVFVVSLATTSGLDELKNSLQKQVLKLLEPKEDTVQESLELEPDEGAYARPDNWFEIERRKGIFFIHGDRPRRLVSVTDLRDPESLNHLYKKLKGMGVIDALEQEGITLGAEINISGVSFSYGDDWI